MHFRIACCVPSYIGRGTFEIENLYKCNVTTFCKLNLCVCMGGGGGGATFWLYELRHEP